MHEVSLVRSLLRQVAQIAAENGGGRVACVSVSIGAISGVEPQLVRDAFAQLSDQTCQPAAELLIDVVPATIVCCDCNHETALTRFIFRCANCQSGRVRLIRGDDFRLLTLTLDREHHAC